MILSIVVSRQSCLIVCTDLFCVCLFDGLCVCLLLLFFSQVSVLALSMLTKIDPFAQVFFYLG